MSNSKTTKKTNSTKAKSLDKHFQDSHVLIGKAKKAISESVFGQETVIDQTITTILSGGHGLLVGVPGVAKTLLVQTIGTVMGLSTNRIQCTPDLMPSDILGAEVLEESKTGTRAFRLIKGPVFTELLIADEINRTSPRTQSALLQSMQENEVSIAGKTHKLPEPFHVLATQNPLEQEGTYPLPEAQLDRFLMQIDVGYPGIDTERRVMIETTNNQNDKIKSVMNKKDVIAIQSLIRDMPVGESVVNAILDLVRGLRDNAKDILWAPGPRASQTLMLAVRAKALIEGRTAPSIDDVVALAVPCLQHRMHLQFGAQTQGITTASLVNDHAAKL